MDIEIPPYLHAHGCPAPLDRIERFELNRPVDQGDGKFVVTRCIECGGHLTAEKEEPSDGE